MTPLSVTPSQDCSCRHSSLQQPARSLRWGTLMVMLVTVVQVPASLSRSSSALRLRAAA